MEVRLENGANLGGLLEKLRIPKEEVTVIMVNGKREKEGYLLQGGDRIGIFPLIGGG